MAPDDGAGVARMGVVLAGGRGSRMGGDKAAAPFVGTTLLAHAVGITRAAGLEPAVCARTRTRLPPIDAAVWLEPAPGSGSHEPLPGSAPVPGVGPHLGAQSDDRPDAAHPLAGLAFALEQAGEPLVAIPVDLPLLPPAVLAALAARPEPLVIVATGGRPAALIVRAGPEHAAALRDAAARGAPALRTLLDLGALAVDLVDLLPGVDAERALLNVNTPGDLRRAAAALGR